MSQTMRFSLLRKTYFFFLLIKKTFNSIHSNKSKEHQISKQTVVLFDSKNSKNKCIQK